MLSALLQRLAWLAEFQVADSSLCQWNLDSGFQSLVAFRIPMPRIPDFTGKNFPDSGNPDSLIKWGEKQSSYIPSQTLTCRVLNNRNVRKCFSFLRLSYYIVVTGVFTDDSIWPVTMPLPGHTPGNLQFFSFLVVYSHPRARVRQFPTLNPRSTSYTLFWLHLF